MSVDAADFALVAKVVYERSGIALDVGKEYLVEARLTTLARRERLGSFAAVTRQLRADPTGPLTAKIVEAMTTNETLWFRDGRPFDVLKSHVLPATIAARAVDRKLVVWSAAASTGQEAYSIAMVLKENFPELAEWRVQILGSDISNEVLERAGQGRYSQLEVGRGLPDALRKKYFARDGSGWRVNAELRDIVQFTTFNLVADVWPLVPTPDIVFLRNVMIYFDNATRRAILKRLAAVMALDGYLFLGVGETIVNLDDSWVRVDVGQAHFFRRAPAPVRTRGKDDLWNRRSTTSSQ